MFCANLLQDRILLRRVQSRTAHLYRYTTAAIKNTGHSCSPVFIVSESGVCVFEFSPHDIASLHRLKEKKALHIMLAWWEFNNSDTVQKAYRLSKMSQIGQKWLALPIWEKKCWHYFLKKHTWHRHKRFLVSMWMWRGVYNVYTCQKYIFSNCEFTNALVYCTFG